MKRLISPGWQTALMQIEGSCVLAEQRLSVADLNRGPEPFGDSTISQACAAGALDDARLLRIAVAL